MRAPNPSFKSELAIYRKAISQWPDDSHRKFVLEILDRWQAHPDAEKAWNDLVQASAKASNPMPPPRIFIAWVISTRRKSEELVRVIRKAPLILPKLSRQADNDWKNKRLVDAVPKKYAVVSFEEQANTVLGRKKKTRHARGSLECGLIPSATTAIDHCMT